MNSNLINLEGVRIEFRNFSGKPGERNREGDRNFCVLLDDRRDLAEELSNEGWNVKYLKPRDDDELPCPYIKVKVSFKKYPPTIYLITEGKKVRLNEKNVGDLDFMEIEYENGERNRVDLQISPYTWGTPGNGGISAYCKALYVRMPDDHFRRKYIDIPEDAKGIMFDDLDD